MSLTALGPSVIAKRLYRSDRIHTALPGVEALDDAAIAAYHRDGFVAIDNVFTPDEVAAGLAGITKLVADGDPKIISFEDAVADRHITGEEREKFVRKCMGFVEHEPRLKALAYHEKFLAIVKKLVGSDVELLQDMALLKPPMVGREKPWHQDSAYFPYGPASLLIGTWTALDAATLENGCMHMIPGSHLEGGKAHYHDRDCQLPDEEVDVARDVAVPLKPGGALFFSSLIHHGTPPNASPDRRRAVQYHYRSVNAKKLDLGEFEQMFHDSHGVAGCASWAYGFKVRPVDSREI